MPSLLTSNCNVLLTCCYTISVSVNSCVPRFQILPCHFTCDVHIFKPRPITFPKAEPFLFIPQRPHHSSSQSSLSPLSSTIPYYYLPNFLSLDLSHLSSPYTRHPLNTPFPWFKAFSHMYCSFPIQIPSMLQNPRSNLPPSKNSP